jgi:hypothetical protein
MEGKTMTFQEYVQKVCSLTVGTVKSIRIEGNELVVLTVEGTETHNPLPEPVVEMRLLSWEVINYDPYSSKVRASSGASLGSAGPKFLSEARDEAAADYWDAVRRVQAQ